MAEVKHIKASAPSKSGTKKRKGKPSLNKGKLNSKPKTFWDIYKEKGAGFAVLHLYNESDGDLLKARKRMPNLIKEGHEQGVDILKFIEELTHALGTDNGVGGIPIDGSDEADKPSDENEGSTASSTASESGTGAEGTESGEGVQ